MKTKFFTFLLFFLLLVVRQADALEVRKIAGNYELQGVMEMAGRLQLKDDGSYRAAFSYGAADWQEEGLWQLEGDEVVLKKGRFKVPSPGISALLLSEGRRFKYQEGVLTATASQEKLVFLDPTKTPSPKIKSADSAGEGRMRVKGKVLSLDANTLVVQMEECLLFDAQTLSAAVLKEAKRHLGKNIDVEIPYASILGSQSCP